MWSYILDLRKIFVSYLTTSIYWNIYESGSSLQKDLRYHPSFKQNFTKSPFSSHNSS